MLNFAPIFANKAEFIDAIQNNKIDTVRFSEVKGWVHPQPGQVPPRGKLSFVEAVAEGLVFRSEDGEIYTLPTTEDIIFQFPLGRNMRVFMNNGNTEFDFIINPLW